MRKIFLTTIILLGALLAGSCINKEALPAEKSQAGSGAKGKTEANAGSEVLTVGPQRQIILSKLNDSSLGLHVYKSYEVKYIDFELEDLTGHKVSLSSFKGKVIFLNFWATWCGPCREEMPAMERVHQELKSRGFTILTINLREDAKTVKAFMEKFGLSFQVLLDKTGEIGSKYGASSIPTSYVFDRKGFAVFGTAGTREWDQPEYMEIFNLLLTEAG